MAGNRAEIKINLNATNFQKGMKAVNKSFDTLGATAVKLNQSIDLFSRIKAPLVANIKAAGEQEQAFKSLDITLKNSGRYTKEYSSELKALAESMSNVSIYGTENIVQGMDILLKFNNVSTDVLPRATQAMIDLASVMGTDVPTAAKLLGQSSDEMTGALARYGISINPVIAKSGDFKKILTEVESKVKGHASAMAHTGYGGFLLMQNAVEDVTKLFGGFALEVGKAGAFEFLERSARSAAEQFDNFLTPEKARDISNNIMDVAITGTTAIGNILSLLDGVPKEVLEYGVLGYLVAGKKGAAIAAIGGYSINKMVEAGDIKSDIGSEGRAFDFQRWASDETRQKVLSSGEAGSIDRQIALREWHIEHISKDMDKLGKKSQKFVQNQIEQLKTEIEQLQQEALKLKDAVQETVDGVEIEAVPKNLFLQYADDMKRIKNDINSKPVKIEAETTPSAGNTIVSQTPEQIKLLDQLGRKIEDAQKELYLMQYPDGFIRDSAAISLQADEYIKKAGLSASAVDEWRDAQMRLLFAQYEYNEAKARELELEKQKEALLNAQAQQIERLKAEIAEKQGRIIYNNNVRQKGEYGANMDAINAEADKMVFDAGDNTALKEAAESWRQISLAENEAAESLKYYKLDFQSATEMMHEGLQSLSQPIADALFKGTTDGLWQALAESLKMFAAQKAAHLLMEAAYQTTMGVATAILGRPESVEHFGAAAEYAAGAALMGTFVVGANLAGQAHEGIDYIPKEGTWLLDRGERVVDSRTNEDLKEFIKSSGTGQPVSITVNIHGGDKEGVLDALPELERAVVNIVSGNIMSGGQIRRTIKEYS